MDDVEVTAVCDLYEDRMENDKERCVARYGHEVFGIMDYYEILNRDDGTEAVLITTYWNSHVKLAIDVMRTEKYAAFEIGLAQSIQHCWDLVRPIKKQVFSAYVKKVVMPVCRNINCNMSHC